MDRKNDSKINISPEEKQFKFSVNIKILKRIFSPTGENV